MTEEQLIKLYKAGKSNWDLEEMLVSQGYSWGDARRAVLEACIEAEREDE